MRPLLHVLLLLLTLGCALPSGSQRPPPMSAHEMAHRNWCATLSPADQEACVRGYQSTVPSEGGYVSTPTSTGSSREAETLRRVDGLQLEGEQPWSPSPEARRQCAVMAPADQDACLREGYVAPVPRTPPAQPPRSTCPGGTTTDGDCCVTGCACGASCISCSSTCRRAEALSEPDASSDASR